MMFRVIGNPAPQGSKSRDRHGNMFESSRSLQPWRAAVQIAVLQQRTSQRRPLISGPVSLEVRFYMRRPKDAKGGARPAVKPDIDKLIRAVGDALTQVGVYEDDSRIVHVTASKFYAGDPNGLAEPGALIFVEGVA